MAAALRTGAPRNLFRSLNASSRPTQHFRSQLCTLSRRPQLSAATTPKTLALVRWASERKPIDNIDHKHEDALHDKTLRPTPDSVSSSSTTSAIFEENPRSGHSADADPKMMAGVNSDLVLLYTVFLVESIG